MTKVLFICHGNICRSPMAEFIFKELLLKNNMQEEFGVSSAATSAEEIRNGIGNPVYPPARDMLARHGISCKGKRAVQMTREDYDEYDYLIGMDNFNLRNMKRITGGDPDGKMYKMMEFAGEGWKKVLSGNRMMEQAADVADPWYTGDFSETWRDLFSGCEGLLYYLKETNNHCPFHLV